MTSISDATETAIQAGGGTSEIGREVRAFLVDTFLLGDDDGFADDASLLDSGIVDSTGVMEVVAFLEERFGIVIDDDELVADNLDSVDRLAAFVSRKRS
jgi:acyl carrier protein